MMSVTNADERGVTNAHVIASALQTRTRGGLSRGIRVTNADERGPKQTVKISREDRGREDRKKTARILECNCKFAIFT